RSNRAAHRRAGAEDARGHRRAPRQRTVGGFDRLVPRARCRGAQGRPPLPGGALLRRGSGARPSPPGSPPRGRGTRLARRLAQGDRAVIAPMLLAVAVAIDPCAPVGPAQKRDVAAAEAYLDVADQEQRGGAVDTAAAAYRSALRVDPQNAKARAALASLCRRATAGEQFGEALRRMESGDRRGAITLFERIRAAGPDPASALLEGICQYELQEDEAAVPLLHEAARDPTLAPAA